MSNNYFSIPDDYGFEEQLDPMISGQPNSTISNQLDPTISTQVDRTTSGQLGPTIPRQLDSTISGQLDYTISHQVDPTIFDPLGPSIPNPLYSPNFEQREFDQRQQRQEQQQLHQYLYSTPNYALTGHEYGFNQQQQQPVPSNVVLTQPFSMLDPQQQLYSQNLLHGPYEQQVQQQSLLMNHANMGGPDVTIPELQQGLGQQQPVSFGYAGNSYMPTEQGQNDFHYVPLQTLYWQQQQLLQQQEPYAVNYPVVNPSVPMTLEIQHGHNPTTIQNFSDFVNNTQANIPIKGPIITLLALRESLKNGATVQRTARENNPLAAYTPITIAINEVCQKIGLGPFDESYVVRLQEGEHFPQLAKGYIKRYLLGPEHAQARLRFGDHSCVSEDNMAVIIEAFVTENSSQNIVLGIIVLWPGEMIEAQQYPIGNAQKGLTAWVLADMRAGEPVFFGIGHPIVRIEEQDEDEDDENDDDDEDEEARSPFVVKTPNAGAGAASKLQVPLAAGLSEQEVLTNHAGALHYANVLKVGLVSNNQEIAAACRKLGGTSATLEGSAVVKRIATAVNWVEDLFGMERGVFRTVYDRLRRANNIKCRSKEEAPDTKIAAHQRAADAALAWIRRGGPLDRETVRQFNIDVNLRVAGLHPDP